METTQQKALTAPGTSGRRVLIVDDDQVNRALLKAILTKAGFQVPVAQDGASALALCAEDPPDLVLLDYMMPNMTGPDVARRMRGQPRMRDVPILLLTATNLDAHIEEGFAAGVDDYLVKPVDRRILVARVEATLRARADRSSASAAAAVTLQRDALVAELDEAREVQRAQLPHGVVTWPGWSAAGAVVPCGAVGGDFFDVLEGMGGRRVALLVDVSGHGVAAALVTARLHAELRSLLPLHPLTEALSLLNDRLLADGTPKYACLAAVELGPEVATIVNAGLPPVCVGGAGGIRALVSATGTPPGLLPGQTYDSEVIPISPGDRIVVMRNGVRVAESTPRKLGGRDLAQAVVSFAVPYPGWEGELPAGPWQSPQQEGDVVLLHTDQPTKAMSILATWAIERGEELLGLTVTRPSLEDAYLQVTRDVLEVLRRLAVNVAR